jgi:hypothetical protein
LGASWILRAVFLGSSFFVSAFLGFSSSDESLESDDEDESLSLESFFFFFLSFFFVDSMGLDAGLVVLLTWWVMCEVALWALV